MIQFVFVAIMLLLLTIKSSLLLAIIIVILMAISFKDALSLSLRVVKSILFFNLGVSIGYVIMSLFKDIDVISYLLYINLKVFSVTYFVFWFFSRVDMVQFFAFSKELSYLLTITLSYIYSYKKTFEDFTLAYKARVIKKVASREKSFITKTFEFFFKKALNDSKEKSLALKARGFFD